MSHIHYGNRKLFFNIERTNRRKTVGIKVEWGANVVVYSPLFLKIDNIKEIIRKRARWIVAQQELVKNTVFLGSTKEFVSGETFSYLGRQYRLKVVRSDYQNNRGCKLVGGRFVVKINRHLSGEKAKEHVREALSDWHFKRAEEKIPERVNIYIKRLGKQPEKIEIKNHKKRWGSCSRNGVVRFNWKIVMAPVTVLDYVLVHELCHLIYPHHSDQFWKKVGAIIPDYDKRRDRLREYSIQIRYFD